MKSEMCQSGELLKQRFDMGMEAIGSDITELKDTCQAMNDTLQNIEKAMAGHIGEHKGSEKCAVDAGRKYGIIYGVVSAAIGTAIAAVAIYEAVSFTGP